MKTLLNLLLLSFSLSVSGSPTFSILKTGQAKTLDAFLWQGGSFKQPRIVNHSGFLIQHKGRHILFDTGLGKDIDNQFSDSMPVYLRPLFRYDKLTPISQQLAVKFALDGVYLSHSHWDHAGGLSDKISPTVYMTPEESGEFSDHQPQRTFLRHFKHVKKTYLTWTEKPYLLFDKHLDLYGDNALVLVPLPGHSTGSMGLLLKGEADNYFFVGDAIWVEEQLNNLDEKFFIASSIVDRDKVMTKQTMAKIKAMRDHYNYRIIPTHDARVQDKLGYFPTFIK